MAENFHGGDHINLVYDVQDTAVCFPIATCHLKLAKSF